MIMTGGFSFTNVCMQALLLVGEDYFLWIKDLSLDLMKDFFFIARVVPDVYTRVAKTINYTTTKFYIISYIHSCIDIYLSLVK